MLTCLHWLHPIHRGPQANTAELAEFSACKTELSLSPALLHYWKLLEMSGPGQKNCLQRVCAAMNQCSSFLHKNHLYALAKPYTSNHQTYETPSYNLLSNHKLFDNCCHACQRFESPLCYVSSRFMHLNKTQ